MKLQFHRINDTAIWDIHTKEYKNLEYMVVSYGLTLHDVTFYFNFNHPL